MPDSKSGSENTASLSDANVNRAELSVGDWRAFIDEEKKKQEWAYRKDHAQHAADRREREMLLKKNDPIHHPVKSGGPLGTGQTSSGTGWEPKGKAKERAGYMPRGNNKQAPNIYPAPDGSKSSEGKYSESVQRLSFTTGDGTSGDEDRGYRSDSTYHDGPSMAGSESNPH